MTASHAFVVPAYGCSPFLRDCLDSLRQQTLRSPIHIVTSTPWEGLALIAEEFGAVLHVHGPNRGIGRDWNAALSVVDADWVTIAHQDDVYLPRFAERTRDALEDSPDAILVFTGYGELIARAVRRWTAPLVVKIALQELAFLGAQRIGSRSAKRRLLRFGCAIPCPSVTLRKLNGGDVFREDLRVNLDWDAWLSLAERSGAFVRVRECLMLHRIHVASETSDGIESGVRGTEDLMIFRRLWPEGVARVLARFYSMSYRQGL